ncbi:SAVED domain-containing protein [Bradyrhizobium septentrionale]|uniref:SAVED domain-containing protein n=1 Tax=Bradyrhizobium septentrionale TaxID=1404411 RepID=A0ABZ2P4L4_9BRAD
MSGPKGPTLTDAVGLGGIVAQDGFDYQVWNVLVRLPAWLRNPAFEGFAIEALEDAEARFFAPRAPHHHLLDRYQAKMGVLARAALLEVFETFYTFERVHPQVARVQTLVTPALPATLTWLSRDPGRVRRARPFYGPFADVRAASDDKLRADLVAELQQPLGDFFADAIEIALWPVLDRATAEASFTAALHEAFPDLNYPPRRIGPTFSALNDLISQSRGVMLTRSRLLDTMAVNLGTELISDRRFLPVHVRSDRNGEAPDAIEIDGSSFSGGSTGFPAAVRWHTQLREALIATANWARKNDFARIGLSGSYRLTTAFLLGWTFRSALGFEIDIPTKGGIWATDAHPPTGGSVLPWSVRPPGALLGDRMVVGIGVLRDPALDIRNHLSLSDDNGLLLATLPQALTDGTDVQASVQTVKAAIAQEAARLRPTFIDLHYVGPAAFAVALGHRWNGLPPTQLYEFVPAEGSYVPTALLM